MVSNQSNAKAEIVGLYNRAADLYGQVGTPRFTYFGDLLVERADVQPGETVLDLATGRGAVLFPAASAVGSGGRVIGIDLSPAMLMRAAAETVKRGLSHTSLLHMDVEHPGFAPGTFDLILCGFAFHFFDLAPVLNALYRLLTPAGRLAFSLPYVPPDEANFARWKWLFDLTTAVFPPNFVPPAHWYGSRLSNPDVVEPMLHEAGFANVRIEKREQTFYFRDADDFWAWEWSQGSRFWLEGMTAEGLEQFRQGCYEHLAAMVTPQGIPMLDGALFAFGEKPD